MDIRKNRSRYAVYVIYLCFFALMLFIALQVPYCHDEWKWGSEERIRLMRQGFPNYNGRYLGNLLALIITRSIPAKAVIISGGLLCLLHVTRKNLFSNGKMPDGKTGVFLTLLSVFLLLALPRSLFAQSYGWPAAFVNFVPPVILFLLYFNWTEPVYSDGVMQPSGIRNVLSVPLGIGTQLFCEHVTLFALAYSVWILLAAAFRRQKIRLWNVLYTVSCAVGTVLMFSNGAYKRAAGSADTYKNIAFSVGSMIRRFYEEIAGPLFLENYLLNILLSVVLIVWIIRKNEKSVLSVEMIFVLCSYSLYSFWHKMYPAWIFVTNEDVNHILELTFSLLFFFHVLLCIHKYVDSDRKYGICMLYASSLGMALPLMAASPIGARCFYVTYVLQSLTVLHLVGCLLEKCDRDLFYPVLAAAVITLFTGMIYGRLFSYIGAADRERAQIITRAVEQGESEITIPLLPFQDYYWITVPPNKKWEKYFKEFYGIPQDVTLNFG